MLISDSGETVVIRTCSVDNWGTQCGDLLFEQGDQVMQPITGCLASCDFDGCNTGLTSQGHVTTWWMLVLIIFFVSHISK